MKKIKFEIDEKILSNPLDGEEKELFEQINGQEVNVVWSKKKKAKQISIKMPEDLLIAIKNKAKEEGLPYQTYIKHILHKAVMN